MTPPPSDSLSFEKALAELDRILRTLEDGTISLEESLSQYERGVSLLKDCYQQLQAAEQRIVKLAGVDEQGRPLFEPFQHASTIEVARQERPARSPRPKPTSDGSY